MGNINRSYKVPAQQQKASEVGMGKCGTKTPASPRGNPNASKSSNSSSKTNKSVSGTGGY